MGLYLLDMVMVAQRWEKSPHPGHYTPEIITHWMEDVALVDGWMTCRDDIHPPPPWTPSFTPWTLGLFDDDVILGFDGDVGVCCHLDTT
jgi:hypothetical protein